METLTNECNLRENFIYYTKTRGLLLYSSCTCRHLHFVDICIGFVFSYLVLFSNFYWSYLNITYIIIVFVLYVNFVQNSSLNNRINENNFFFFSYWITMFISKKIILVFSFGILLLYIYIIFISIVLCELSFLLVLVLNRQTFFIISV